MSALIKRIGRDEQTSWLQALALSAHDRNIMANCLLLSDLVWVGTIDGEFACIWGLIPPSLMSDRAYLWLFTGPLIEEHKFIFVRHSQLVVDEMLKQYGTITGHAIAGSTRSIRWLKWLGAKFSEPNGKMIPFRISRHGSS